MTTKYKVFTVLVEVVILANVCVASYDQRWSEGFAWLMLSVAMIIIEAQSACYREMHNLALESLEGWKTSSNHNRELIEKLTYR